MTCSIDSSGLDCFPTVFANWLIRRRLLYYSGYLKLCHWTILCHSIILNYSINTHSQRVQHNINIPIYPSTMNKSTKVWRPTDHFFIRWSEATVAARFSRRMVYGLRISATGRPTRQMGSRWGWFVPREGAYVRIPNPDFYLAS